MSEPLGVFTFDIRAIIINAVISAAVLFIIGFLTRRAFGFDLGKVVSVLEKLSIFVVPYLLFWYSHQNPSLQAIFDYMTFLFTYLPTCLVALIGMIVGEWVGAIGSTAETEFFGAPRV